MLRVGLHSYSLGSMLLCNPLSGACLVAGAGRAIPRGSGGGRRSLHGGVSESSSASTWRKPDAGWLKLNFDGSSKHASRRASIGGVYRDHDGGFVLGYAERIVGTATSSVAELAALRRGLELAAANGWRSSCLWIEGDAMTAVDVVFRDRARVVRSAEDQRHCEEIAALVPLFRYVRVSHVRRQGNRVAHGFAKLGHGLALPRVWHAAPTEELIRRVLREAEGK